MVDVPKTNEGLRDKFMDEKVRWRRDGGLDAGGTTCSDDDRDVLCDSL